MRLKLFIFLVFSYVIAFSANLIPSFKHPDSTMNIFNLFATALFLIALLILIKEVSYSSKSKSGLKILFLFGSISGLIVYSTKKLESTMINYTILDIIASIQYPFYLIYTTPLFGINYLLNLNYETFSLLMTPLYVIAFIQIMSFKKVDIRKV
ncbi:hypothetical protein JOC25_000487 [Solibacillus kalamii]|uniref:Uncharacterized protein n=1 Tax=Solibacillus kalamii TaxID=1748298 RepID=A0ABX3ZKD4_9BACL|nr:hypothetical protein [Solibacillus kalamii]MBM7664031.1 hypothetical protein [Solibacillus kalamii]OUZ40191.1 hypothetical protein CBM15_06660 [Solibacillus kalamii]